MRFGDLEKEIESKLIPLFRTCEKYLQRILSAVRGLLNLRVAATICSMKLSELRQRLKTILVSELWVKKIHRVSFDEECTYSLFWTPVLNCVTDEDAPVLFRRKLCGTIVPVCNEAARKKFDCEGPLLMKSLGRFSFLYIEFEPEQVLLKVQDYCRRLQLLRCIFRVVEIEDVYEFGQAVLQLAEQLTTLIEEITQQTIRKEINRPLAFEDQMVLVHNEPGLSLGLSALYGWMLAERDFYRDAMFKNHMLPLEGLTVVLKDGLIVVGANLQLFGAELFSKVSLQDLLKNHGLSAQEIADIISKEKVDGTYRESTNGNWILCVNTFRASVEFSLLSVAHFDKKTAEMICSIVQDTIGLEFMPVRKLSKRQGTRKLTVVKDASKRATVKICRELVVDFSRTASMAQINSVEFNILEYTPQVACSIAHQILKSRFNHIGFEDAKLRKYIAKVGYKYQKHSNPFHNIFHGATVMHGAYLLSSTAKFKATFKDMHAFSFVVAGLCHDLNHTGRTNIFEEKTESRLANRYGDRSVLESYSIAKALKLLTDESTNFIPNMNDADWRLMRRLLIATILATDNKNHTPVLAEFETFTTSPAGTTPGPITLEGSEKILGALLHCCDFWGNTKKYVVSRAWADRVNQQFANQYAKEIELGIDPTPYFKNLENPQTIAKNEKVFISMFVQPLYRKVNCWLEGYLSSCLHTIELNLRVWKKVEEGASQEVLQALIDSLF